MRQYLEKKLANYARRQLAKSEPEVIGITGSVGKSSAKEAVAAVMGRGFPLLASPRNMNTEIGLPLAVLGLPGGGRSAWRWLKILLAAWWKVNFRKSDLPSHLVLEMAADRPGDIKHLAEIAKPHIGVITAVSSTHLEKFGSVEEIVVEKGRLIEALPKDGVAILNRDDERVWGMRDRTKARVLSYGFDQDADVKVVPGTLNYAYDPEGEDCGMRFKVVADGSTVPMFIPGVLGRQAAYAALAGIAVGLAKGMNLVDISAGLRDFKPLPGRVRCLTGIKKTILIDDSYNASPRSVKAALDLLFDLPVSLESKRIVALGDMLELGEASEDKHRIIGRKVAELGPEMLVLVGERMHDAAVAAEEAGLSKERIFHFADTGEAGRFIQEKLEQGDIVLIKGSRGMRMEAITKELMADPLRAPELLVSVPDEDK